jgi:SAM-dependent methyltransferase
MPANLRVMGSPKTYFPSKGEKSARNVTPKKEDPMLQVDVETWNRQYGRGAWSYLSDLKEVPRYAIQASWIGHLQNKPSILDVACGEGLLVPYLRFIEYERYLGIDISEVAIRAAKMKEDDRTQFLVEDAQHYVASAKYTCIIFNESLYYFRNPVELVRHYCSFLWEEGIVIISVFLSAETKGLVPRLRSTCDVLEELTISNSRGVWETAIIRPKKFVVPR